MKQKKNSGIALFFILGTIFLVSISVFFMVYFMRGEAFLSENYVDGVQALLLAEAGAEEAFFTLKKQVNDPKNPFYALVSKSESGFVDVDVGDLEGKDRKIPAILEGGTVKARVSWENDPNTTKGLQNAGLPANVAREGTVTVIARGNFRGSSKQIEIKRGLKAVLVQSQIKGNGIGMIAPDHGLYLNNAHPDSFKIIPTDFWDPWGFTVKGGKVFMRDGARVDIPKWLMLFDMRSQFDHPFLDQGIGWNGYNGGGNFAKTDAIEYSKDPVTRSYYKWNGPLHFPWWEKIMNENYDSETKQVPDYQSTDINLYPEKVYRQLANRLVDPETNPTHGKYFTDVNFRNAFGQTKTDYKNVIPLYGWGDWRKVPNKYNLFLGNPNRADDTTHAVEMNGLTYIHGDVFLEGWVKGQGLLVVEGNVYIGGDVVTLPDDSGQQSALGVIAIRDSRFDTAKEKPLTGKIIYAPHHDSDWSRFGITNPFINLSPRLEGSFYAAGGMELKTNDPLAKLINMEIVGNYVTDYFDRRRMPNDVSIKYYNWQDILSNSKYDYTTGKQTKYNNKYNVSLKKEIISWREMVPATL
ncbi:MAG: hypothetical protein HQM08_27790 [Candidatus Riflebacteria bacterium]|nr:hypothetical protein [Candidatus Riflebacteria bacterium]